MRYIIETGYPKNTLFAKKVFTPGWYGSEPYFEMGHPLTDNIGTQHVDLRLRNQRDPALNGNVIGKAHAPANHTIVSHEDIDRVINDIENGNVEKGLEMLRVMRGQGRRQYQSHVSYKK